MPSRIGVLSILLFVVCQPGMEGTTGHTHSAFHAHHQQVLGSSPHVPYPGPTPALRRPDWWECDQDLVHSLDPCHRVQLPGDSTQGPGLPSHLLIVCISHPLPQHRRLHPLRNLANLMSERRMFNFKDSTLKFPSWSLYPYPNLSE